MQQMYDDQAFYEDFIKEAAQKYTANNINIKMKSTKHVGCAAHHLCLVLKHAHNKKVKTKEIIKASSSEVLSKNYVRRRI